MAARSVSRRSWARWASIWAATRRACQGASAARAGAVAVASLTQSSIIVRSSGSRHGKPRAEDQVRRGDWLLDEGVRRTFARVGASSAQEAPTLALQLAN